MNLHSSITSSRHNAKTGRGLRRIEFSQIIVGSFLALCGLLDLGNHTVEFDGQIDSARGATRIAPLYYLVDRNWAIPAILIVYMSLQILHMVSGLLTYRQTVSKTFFPYSFSLNIPKFKVSNVVNPPSKISMTKVHHNRPRRRI